LSVVLNKTDVKSLRSLRSHFSPAGRDESRALALDAIADFIRGKQIVRTGPVVNLHGDVARHTRSSQWNLTFMMGAAAIADNARDGLLALPVQLSGYSTDSRVSPGTKPDSQRRTATDLVVIKVTVVGLLGDDAANSNSVARIEIPTMSNPADFNAPQLIRDLIQFAFEWYLPGVDIEGEKRFEDKRIVVRNNTNEKVFVYLRI